MKIIYFFLFFVFFSVDAFSASIKTMDSFTLHKKINDFLKKENLFNKNEIDVIIRNPLNKNIRYCKKPIFTILNNLHHFSLIHLLLTCSQSKYYLTVEIQSKGEYVVAKKYIPRGMKITESDLTTLIGRLDKLPNHIYHKKSEVIGRVNIKDILPFQIITAFMTRPLWLVKANQNVIIILKGKNFSIALKARSLDNGSKNEKIRVKTNTGKILNGIVNKKGKVIISV